MCSWRARSQCCCQLERWADRRRLCGGPLRPTDRAMAARSIRMSSSEEGSRSTEEEERLLKTRCIERPWKNTWETLLEQQKDLPTQTVTSFLPGNIPVSRRSTPLMFKCDFCVSMVGREPTSDCSKEHNTALPLDRRYIHPCCRLHGQKSKKPQLLLIDRGSDLANNTLLLHLRHKNCEDQVHQQHLQRSIASGTRCKRRRRFRTAVAIKLPVYN